MLKRHSQFLKSVLFLFDLGLICACWVGAYYLRFSDLAAAPKGVPPLPMYLWLLIPIVGVWGISFQAFDLYRPRRMGTHLAEFLDVAKANTLSVLILVALTFFIRQYEYSRLVLLYFWLLNLLALGFSRVLFREALRFLRRQGYNQRHALVVGAGRLGRRVVDALARHPELGVKVHGYLSSASRVVGDRINNVPVLGRYDDLLDRVQSGIDIVFVCLPPEDEPWAEKMFAVLSNTMVEVKALPAICEFVSLRAEAEIFEGLPLITLQGSPLHGWNLVIKRAMDVVGATAALLLFSPVLLGVAALVKLTSPGPIFFRQLRMGLDGQAFEMLKFRSMKVDAESETGPVWTQPNDDRRTPIGAFLRRTSLDELPQFWNVLRGEMSIVGPRPERPEFIARFRETLPQYMLRHKMKAGITGWAQVNGWRGNTSLERRIEHDLYYIEHWSMWFDIKIMWLTLWRGFIHRHAY
ncbi:MAG: UDP-glucose:undecaprenyl-phosphate glucose-1-phosphate transferase [Nitrospirae bacterium]|nr:MAG: putative undecaprenyl-phosphate glucose phosphotransferase [Nitrospira sp. OLB3]MBV6470219.1 UDP-glucose:undecaprenyl-phosphate glucose-1-phosphate transferase [Nitrospirota bacterium]MCE7964251.1 undecaprenyl-phosphate glucose phosphotransferase [Nitrospira sp. NTP2]MCK6492672.1 undecaprenyl-phosphate glucose phosphotransferase [Nitrospira sp.]MEB2337257.1 undecaprenyl-phosphate glucose phosphotransferase [Nitrospirales bacterium]